MFKSRIKFSIYISFSICADTAYKNPLGDVIFNNDSSSIDAIGSLVKENIWNKNETFYYLDFPTVGRAGFPCMTTKDSVDPIRSCMQSGVMTQHFVTLAALYHYYGKGIF